MVTIRNATSEDKDVIVDFQLAMALETETIHLDVETVSKGVEAVLKDATKGKYFVAEMDGEIVGSLLITFEWSDWRNGVVYWIQSVYVMIKYRNKGVFRELYAHVKKIADNSEEIVGIRLYVDVTNEKAQIVYGNLGMDGDHYKVFEWMCDKT